MQYCCKCYTVVHLISIISEKELKLGSNSNEKASFCNKIGIIIYVQERGNREKIHTINAWLEIVKYLLKKCLQKCGRLC
jgi:hypothetical protein